MLTGAAQLGRAARAELTRAGGLRSVVWLGAVPGAILLPLAVTLGVATVAERFASLSGDIQVTSVTTTNSVYWVITFTVMVWAVIAAYAHATGERGPIGETHRYLFPRTATTILARWLVYGFAAALCSLILVAAVMILLPTVFPEVYAGVELTSDPGIRFLVTVPLYALLAVGIGVGLAAIINHPATAVVALLGWTYVIENAVSLIPNGYTIQTYMPFLNGIYGTGQELAFLPPWGPNGALVYCAAIAASLIALGCTVSAARRRQLFGRLRFPRVAAGTADTPSPTAGDSSNPSMKIDVT